MNSGAWSMESSPSAGVSHCLKPLQPGSVGHRRPPLRWSLASERHQCGVYDRKPGPCHGRILGPRAAFPGPRDLSLVTLHIPDGIPYTTMTIADLPANWRDYPPPPALADLGVQWVTALETL